MLCENHLRYSCVPLGIMSCTLYEALCQAAFHCENVCVYFCAFLWWWVYAVWQLHQTAKMTDEKEQWICNKFCFKLSKMPSETHSMLEEAFGDNALGQTQTYKWLSISRMDGCQLLMKSVPDNPQRNHNRKCGKSLALKALSIRNLFHQDRQWMENSFLAF